MLKIGKILGKKIIINKIKENKYWVSVWFNFHGDLKTNMFQSRDHKLNEKLKSITLPITGVINYNGEIGKNKQFEVCGS